MIQLTDLQLSTLALAVFDADGPDARDKIHDILARAEKYRPYGGCEHTTWPPPGYPDLEVSCERILNTNNDALLRDTAKYVARVVLKTLKSPS